MADDDAYDRFFWRPGPNRCDCRSRAPTAPCPYAALACRLPRHHQGGQDRAARSSLARALSGWKWQPAARPRYRGPRGGAGQRPMERILGSQIGDFVRALHEEHGVIFHLGDTVTAIDGPRRGAQERRRAGSRPGGRGCRRAAAFGASRAGRARTRSRRRRDAYLETSAPVSLQRATSRAGPIRIPATISASSTGWWPNAKARPPRTTCWARERFDAVPFFWSQHYDIPINYVGHAERWDELAIEGDLGAKDCVLRYKRRADAGGRRDLSRRRKPPGRNRDGAANHLLEVRLDGGARRSTSGCSPVDPELMIRMLIIGYCYGIRSERRLTQEVEYAPGGQAVLQIGSR